MSTSDSDEKNKKKRRRADRLELEQHISTAEQLLIRGISTTQIITLLRQQSGCCIRNAYRYLKMAKSNLKKEGQQPASAHTGLLMRRNDYLFQLALMNKDISLASKITGQQMNFVLNLEKHKGGTSAPISDSSRLSTEELEALMRELTEDGSE